MHPMSKSKKKTSDNTIAQNKRARFDYHILETFEAGVSLSGWEVKALRAGRAQLTDSYVFMKNGEAFLLNAQITPLETVSTHFVTEPTRSRKLLLNKRELAKLNEAVSRIPGKKAKRLPPNASQSAAIQSRFARLSFDGSVFSEAP